jgi:hypothetical protein
MRIPTVKIKHDHPRGYAIINASDFDAERHELYDEADAVVVKGAIEEGEGGFARLPEASQEEKTSEPVSEDEMRAAIKNATGKAPHHKLGIDKLREKYEALQK